MTRYKLYVVLSGGRRKLLYYCEKISDIISSGHRENMDEEYRGFNWYIEDNVRGKIISKEEFDQIFEKPVG